MSGGVTEDDLKELWFNDKQDWFGYLQELINASLVKKETLYVNENTRKIRYNLLPFMNYTSIQINQNTLGKYDE